MELVSVTHAINLIKAFNARPVDGPFFIDYLINEKAKICFYRDEYMKRIYIVINVKNKQYPRTFFNQSTVEDGCISALAMVEALLND